jgi:hypothetical protein
MGLCRGVLSSPAQEIWTVEEIRRSLCDYYESTIIHQFLMSCGLLCSDPK